MIDIPNNNLIFNPDKSPKGHLFINHPAAGGAAAVLGHPVEHPVLAVVVVVGIAVVAAVDVVGDAGLPAGDGVAALRELADYSN